MPIHVIPDLELGCANIDPRQARIDERNPEIGALLGCAVITGVGAVFNSARLQAGSSVAVVGVGGIGLNIIQGAALAGAERIIAVDLNPDKASLASTFGATDFVLAEGDDPRVMEAAADLAADPLADVLRGSGFLTAATTPLIAKDRALGILVLFTSAELFMLTILGLSMVGVLAGDSLVRGAVNAALLATAIGLVAAIPAVIFYNKFSADAARLNARLEAFADEFAAIVSRQIDHSSRG